MSRHSGDFMGEMFQSAVRLPKSAISGFHRSRKSLFIPQGRMIHSPAKLSPQFE